MSVFLLPLGACLAGGLLFLFSDVEWKWKALAVLLVGGSVAMQYVPPLVEMVPWGVPISMQIVAAIWFWLYWRLEGV
jgi:hypothetical protein